MHTFLASYEGFYFHASALLCCWMTLHCLLVDSVLPLSICLLMNTYVELSIMALILGSYELCHNKHGCSVSLEYTDLGSLVYAPQEWWSWITWFCFTCWRNLYTVSIVAAPTDIPNSNAYGSSFLTPLPEICFLDGILLNEWGWDGLSM